MTSLATLRKKPQVELVDDERAYGNGIIVTLKRGWTFDPMEDNRVAGEDTVSEAVRLVASAKPYAGPFDPMTAADFNAWLAAMGLNDVEAARRLGCVRNSVAAWRVRGGPRWLGLTCAAVSHGLKPWKQPFRASD